MEHFRYETDRRWFVGVRVGEGEGETERAVFERRVGWRQRVSLGRQHDEGIVGGLVLDILISGG